MPPFPAPVAKRADTTPIESPISAPSDRLEGCYPVQSGLNGPFIWAQAQFRLHLPKSATSMILRLAYLGQEGTILVFQDGVPIAEARLRHGWQECALSLPLAAQRLSFQVDPVSIIESDDRELGVMIRAIIRLADERDFALLEEVDANANLNAAEYGRGAVLPEDAELPPAATHATPDRQEQSEQR